MQALYRTYRPQTLADLVGQEHISANILKALQNGKISHAYLFIGPRGTGKTSTARILAKALGCEKGTPGKWSEPCNSCNTCKSITDGSYLDLIEIDAASNRGIDEIRDLREKIKLAPTQGKYKIYIIDEVHMLTSEAFNALLKTLEEPPPHALFILCTTDPQKIPGTIKSRCQVFEFKRPSIGEIISVLEKVVLAEKIKIEKRHLELIAKKAKGAYRDALVLLEKFLISGEVDKEVDLPVLALLILEGNHKDAISLVHQALAGGINPKAISEALLDWYRKALLLKIGLIKEVKEEVGEDDYLILMELAKKGSVDLFKKLIATFTSSLEEFRYSPIPQLPLELAIVTDLSASAGSVTLEQSPITNDKAVILSPQGEESERKESLPLVQDVRGFEEPLAPRKDGSREEEIIINKETNVAITPQLAAIKEKWLDLLRKLRPVNHSLEALLRSSEPVSFEEGALTLKFFYRFHKERVEEAKNRKLVEKVFHEELGMPITLKFVLSETRKPISKKEASQTEVPNVKIVTDENIGEAALDIFSN